MASRVKEEEKIERTIRNLLKLPENRRCINCNSLGPQYVCTTFLTFVCTNCSGVHREFTHRVKSVSMAKFTADEVTALQAAGNERARQIYLKAWDPQRHSYPDCSNLHKLRDFIKHVYVDRRYTGEKSANELPRLRLSGKDSSQERRKVTPYYGGLQSQGEMSSSSARRDHRSSLYYYDERSSPRYSKENSRYGGYRKSLTCIEVVDDRIRDDKPGNNKLSNGESKSSSRVTDSQENLEKSSPAVACNNKDVSDENEPPRIVQEDVKANKGVDAGGSDQDQNFVSVNPVETRRDNVESLIDFSISFEPSDAAATSQTQQMPSSNDNGNWDAFELPAKQNTSVAPSANTLEALLFELSVPSTEAETTLTDGPVKAAVPSILSGTGIVTPDFIRGQTALPINVEACVVGSTKNVPLQPSDASPLQLASNNGGDNALAIIDGQHPPSTQQKHACNYPSTDTAAVVPNFEWTSSSDSNAQGYLSVSTDTIAEADSKPAQGTTIGVEPQPPSLEVNSCGRKELPADLFTIHYPPLPTPNPGWQTVTHRVMDYSSQYYPNTMSAMEFAKAARRTNPFDLDDEKSRLYLQFPSTPSLQSAHTSMPASTGLTNTPSDQAQYSDIYGGQQAYGIPSVRPQGVGNYGSNGPAFGSFNTSLQPSSGYPTPNTKPTSSNPFG